jgi:S-DNA-T family DNA segregation ATPase FtsK/SpoIIIE
VAHYQPIDTDDGAVPALLRRFLRNRLMELTGIVLFAAAVVVSIALATWSAEDPSFNHAVDAVPRNWLGFPGAVIADELMQLFGLGVLAVIAIPLSWSVRFLTHAALNRPFKSLLAWLATIVLASGTFAIFPKPASWALSAGLGGNAGDILSGALTFVLSGGLKGIFPGIVATILCGFGAVSFGLYATGLTREEVLRFSRIFGASAQDFAGRMTGLVEDWGARWSAFRARRRAARDAAEDEEDAKPAKRVSRAVIRQVPGDGRLEPRLEKAARRVAVDDEEDDTGEDEADDEESVQITPKAGPAKAAKRASRVARIVKPRDDFELPDLDLLAEPKKPAKGSQISDDVLEENARALEGVLEDFGVKGQIINVRPGPVVTLYELEPAPGIKSSRVISLADDIARSMSAVSARVAVIPGRNVIGIELPNAKRETVYLRELLGAEAFVKSTQHLAMALGKNIGGEPVFADLARMPHLLIAGTTGSGKSVGINAMILSLLYRHPPERCRIIMIDPKMLELSVYEGIPHLLAPVVTDPRKAVVALKWAVREMEDRYRKMSKVGVRNIDGFNARAKLAQAKGEQVTRTVQTGFDAETGEPVFEREAMDLAPLPFIVVIIDEMADLMLVAGKEIEGAVQRLAQMARAAGIHVIMATQRPSVDVITGTIKANFPTRISFQVTSKIDSRTILGEQGAEQLLGQGDMLYMAGGGRISRLHGPFVSDDEVEKIVAHLKDQGTPEYLDAVTEEPEEGEAGGDVAGGEYGGSGDSLYDQAVQVVLRDKKVSTSYVQRRLQVGYNKAASLIERMEKEGLISAPNVQGKREILVPGDSAR